MQAAVGLGMNAGVQSQCVDVRIQAVEEVVTDPGLLALIEHIAFQQVGFCRACYSDTRHVSQI